MHDSLDLLALGGGPLTTEQKDLIGELGLAESVISLPIVSDGILAEVMLGLALCVPILVRRIRLFSAGSDVCRLPGVGESHVIHP